MQEDALKVRVRAEGLASLVGGASAAGREESGMMGSVETRLEGSTLVVRIPMRFQRRGGRKRIVAPDGSELAPRSKPQPDGTLVKALVRAWRWQRMLDEGIYTSVSEIGDAENISKSCMSLVLRLALLAPDIIEAIVTGRAGQSVMLEKLERLLPASWEEQRQVLRIRRSVRPRMIASAAFAAALALRPPAEVRSPTSMVVAVQDLGGDPRVVGEPLRRQGRQACASGVQEAFARKRVQYVGVAEAGRVAHRNDRPTNVKVVAMRVRQGVN